jgi:TPR repeat protein
MIKFQPPILFVIALSLSPSLRAAAAATAPTPTPAAQEAAAPAAAPSQATYCDRYAASEFDIQSPSFGVPFNRVDPKAAIPACLDALARYPHSPRLAYQLGRAYAAGRDYGKAMEYFQKAAEANFALAELNIGSLYSGGLGVPKDEAEAFKWTRMAADQGLAPAAGNLGEMFLNGQGAPEDDALAARWLDLAARQGYAAAQSRLATLFATGKGVKQNFAAALALNAQAASQGYAPAMADLGSLSAMWQDEKQQYAAAEPAPEPAIPDPLSEPVQTATAPPPTDAPTAAPAPPPAVVEEIHPARTTTAALAPSIAPPQPAALADPPAHDLTLASAANGGSPPVKLALKLLEHRNSSGIPITAIEVSPTSDDFSLSGVSVNGGACPVYARDPATLLMYMRLSIERTKAAKDNPAVDYDSKYRRLAADYVPLPTPFNQPMTAEFGQYLRFYVDPSACSVRDVQVVVNGKGWTWRE